jgi:hypothetical protein
MTNLLDRIPTRFPFNSFYSHIFNPYVVVVVVVLVVVVLVVVVVVDRAGYGGVNTSNS